MEVRSLLTGHWSQRPGPIDSQLSGRCDRAVDFTAKPAKSMGLVKKRRRIKSELE